MKKGYEPALSLQCSLKFKSGGQVTFLSDVRKEEEALSSSLSSGRSISPRSLPLLMASSLDDIPEHEGTNKKLNVRNREREEGT